MDRFLTESKLQSLENKVFEFEFSLSLSLPFPVFFLSCVAKFPARGISVVTRSGSRIYTVVGGVPAYPSDLRLHNDRVEIRLERETSEGEIKWIGCGASQFQLGLVSGLLFALLPLVSATVMSVSIKKIKK